MTISQIRKSLKIFCYFKNPFVVLNFYRGNFVKGKKIMIKPRKGRPFAVARFGDLWVLNKILNGGKIEVFYDKDKKQDYIIENGIYLRQGTSDTFVYKEVFIEECYKKCADRLNGKSMVVDIGAHVGLFSLYCSPKCDRVYSYEAHPENFSLALKNIKNKKAKNIDINNLAVWSSSGREINIFSNDSRTGEHTVGERADGRDGALKVKTTSIYDIFEKYNIVYCDLLKMDIEGAEYQAFFSTPKSLFKRIGNICMEYHADIENKHNIEDLKNLLINNGFEIEIEKINNDTGLLNAFTKLK